MAGIVNFINDQSGAQMVEYAFMLVAIAIALFAIVTLMGQNLVNLYGNVGGYL